MRALSFLSVVALAGACGKKAAHEIDHDLVHVTGNARLRTDSIGAGKWTENATFVLVDAQNTATEGAYVTLTGDLAGEGGTKIGELKPQSLWIPAGEVRTFALVDRDRKPRPEAKGASIRVRGAYVTKPPPAHIADFHQDTDGDKIVVRGTLSNEGARGGNIMVVATFWDAHGEPMTRPFSVLWVDAKQGLPVQFVGPAGSTRGTIFVGDTVF